jgi:hypothetical protein
MLTTVYDSAILAARYPQHPQTMDQNLGSPDHSINVEPNCRTSKMTVIVQTTGRSFSAVPSRPLRSNVFFDHRDHSETNLKELKVFNNLAKESSHILIPRIISHTAALLGVVAMRL